MLLFEGLAEPPDQILRVSCLPGPSPRRSRLGIRLDESVAALRRHRALGAGACHEEYCHRRSTERHEATVGVAVIRSQGTRSAIAKG